MPADLQRNQRVYNSMSEGESGREGGQRSSQGSIPKAIVRTLDFILSVIRSQSVTRQEREMRGERRTVGSLGFPTTVHVS